MKVRLNLATNGLQTHRKFLAGSALIGVIAGAVFVALVWHVYSGRRADEAVRPKAGQVRQGKAGSIGHPPKIRPVFCEEQETQLHGRAELLQCALEEQKP